MSDVKRLLYTVQKQRQEHRKLQRLMLDTSGHSLSLYQAIQQQVRALGVARCVALQQQVCLGVGNMCCTPTQAEAEGAGCAVILLDC
jgi:hypothetical protein